MIDPKWRPPVLRGEGLLLRPLAEADAADVFAYASNPNMTPHSLWDAHKTVEDSRQFVTAYAESHYAEEEPEPMGIVLGDREAGHVIGTVGCHWRSRKSRQMELGFALAEPHWGKGITTTAAQLLLGHVFENYDVERVQARCMVENTASARVLRKLGMTHEGTLRSSVFLRGEFRDLHMFSLLRREHDSVRGG